MRATHANSRHPLAGHAPGTPTAPARPATRPSSPAARHARRNHAAAWLILPLCVALAGCAAESPNSHRSAGPALTGLVWVGTGACCFADGSCQLLSADDCPAFDGTYLGDDTVCDPNPCPQPDPVGACCSPDGWCELFTAAECSDAVGSYQGDGTVCDPNPCAPPAGEGCAARFWRMHRKDWKETGHYPAQRVGQVFELPHHALAYRIQTLLQALTVPIGPIPPRLGHAHSLFARTLQRHRALSFLQREGVTALLNAAHPGVAYPLTKDEVRSRVESAWRLGDPERVLDVARELGEMNAQECPLLE